MTRYLDASAVVKLYVAEDHSKDARARMASEPSWITARHTCVEVRRALVRTLGGRDLAAARKAFDAFWQLPFVVELGADICGRAAEMAERNLAGTLDALHVAGAEAAGDAALTFDTYDLRQAVAARALGWTVVGAP